MLADTSKLHWLGLDMRARWRRRLAVVATYTAFLVAVWVHPPGTSNTVWMLWAAWWLGLAWTSIREKISVWTGRLLKSVALVALVGFWASPLSYLGPSAGIYLLILLRTGSVFEAGKLVDRGDMGWMAKAIRKGAALNRRDQRRLVRAGFAVGLDGFALYEFGARFERLTDEEKLAVEQLNRSYPHGKWGVGLSRTILDDERMRHEDDRLRAQVQRVMSWVLVGSAFAWCFVDAMDWHRRTDIVVAWAFTLAALSITLREAIVLWTEDDPREVTGELELVHVHKIDCA